MTLVQGVAIAQLVLACVTVFFAIAFIVKRKKLNKEDLLLTIFLFSSAIWGAFQGVMYLSTDPVHAIAFRFVGLYASISYLIVVQVMLCQMVGMKKARRNEFVIILCCGLVGATFMIFENPLQMGQQARIGMTYTMRFGFSAVMYPVYVIGISIQFARTLYQMTVKGSRKLLRKFGRMIAPVAVLVFLTSWGDVFGPSLGFYCIPGSSLFQYAGMIVVYIVVLQRGRVRVNFDTMSEYIYSSLSFPIVVFDDEYIARIANEKACSAFGLSVEGLNRGDYRVSSVLDVEDEKSVFDFESRQSSFQLHAAGRCCMMQVQVDKILDEYEEVIGYIVSLNDLTEQIESAKRLSEALEKAELANKSKSAFLANMSHEIRTPMNAIIGFSELMLKLDELPEQAKEYAGDIKTSSQGLLAIINDILDISKIESGKMEIIENDYYISRVMQDVSLIIHTQTQKKNLEFKINVEGDIPGKLFGDKVRIRGVLINILNNAVKYTKEGRVSFTMKATRPEPDLAMLEFIISDTGSGIKQEDIPRLFETFAQVDQKMHSGVEGTGLGLPIAKGYVDLMKGEISVKSEYGKGSTFIVKIPQRIVDDEPMRWSGSSIQGEIAASIGNMKVRNVSALIVDDSRMNLKVEGNILRQYGIQVDTASGGLEAIVKCREHAYDIVFMDQMMPEMDGIEAMRQIRAEIPGYEPGSGSRIVVLTANAINGMREQLLAEGFDEYLGKPLNYNQLENVIRKFTPEDQIYYEE